MCVVITDPLYEVLSTLAVKKAAWLVIMHFSGFISTNSLAPFFIVHYSEFTQREPECSSLHDIPYRR